MKENQWIIEAMPYGAGFLFVDHIDSFSENSISGRFRFRENLSFYADHFPDAPVTPGVILTECMAQISLLALGIVKLSPDKEVPPYRFAFSSSDVEFLRPVWPGTEVQVVAEEIYFRFGKLKVRAEMKDEKGQLMAKAVLAGMLVKNE